MKMFDKGSTEVIRTQWQNVLQDPGTALCKFWQLPET